MGCLPHPKFTGPIASGVNTPLRTGDDRHTIRGYSASRAGSRPMKNIVIACFAVAALSSCVAPQPRHGSLSPPTLTALSPRSEAPLVSTWSAQGAIKFPGHYRLEQALTLRGAIALAGGLTADADHSNIQLIHPDRSGQTLTYRQTRTSHLTIQAGDALYFPALSRKRLDQGETTPWPPFVPANLPVLPWLGGL
jgi:hypothetical protein